jgi:hypothetical protein
MMAPAESFSKRHGFRGQPKEITVREDAPEPLRYFVVQTAIDGGLSPSYLRRALSIGSGPAKEATRPATDRIADLALI